MPTRKSNEYNRIWVREDFKRLLKSEAALEGMDIITYTERLSKDYWNKQKKGGFKFGF